MGGCAKGSSAGEAMNNEILYKEVLDLGKANLDLISKQQHPKPKPKIRKPLLLLLDPKPSSYGPKCPKPPLSKPWAQTPYIPYLQPTTLKPTPSIELYKTLYNPRNSSRSNIPRPITRPASKRTPTPNKPRLTN